MFWPMQLPFHIFTAQRSNSKYFIVPLPLKFVCVYKEIIFFFRFSFLKSTYFRTQNYWVFGPFPSSGILENKTFRKLDLFPSSGEGGGEDTYSVGPPHSPEDGNRSSLRNVVFSRIPDDGKKSRIYNILRLI
jgi:hypothetical protein